MVNVMELRQLRYFVAVAEDANISRAAKRIFLTQPALSRQIKALEEEVGVKLLERSPHSIRLTEPGEVMLHEARDLLERTAIAVERVRAVGRGPRLRVGYAPSLAAGILSGTVECFTQTHAEARVELFDMSTAEMLAGLEDRTLDVAVGVEPARESRELVWIPLVRVKWQIAVNRKHAFAGRRSLTPRAVAAEPLLMFCRRGYPEYWDLVAGWLQGHGLRPRIVGEHDGVDSLMSAVAAGLGVALVTDRTAVVAPNRVRLKDLAPAPEPLCIAAGYRADRKADKPLAVFVEELKKAAGGG